jgi:hypothetical protein
VGTHELRKKYGKTNSREVVNRAIRAEVPGGGLLLDLIMLVHQMRQRNACPQAVMDRLQAIRDAMAEHVVRTSDPQDAGQKPAPPDVPAVIEKPVVEGIEALKSAPPEPAATGAISLAALAASRKLTAEEAAAWTPPAAIVEIMGKVPDRQVAELAGVSPQVISRERRRLGIDPAVAPVGGASVVHRWTDEMDTQLGKNTDEALGKRWGMSREAVARRREELGIAAFRRVTAWTPERLAILDNEPNNAKAAEALGISQTAVRVARSRRPKHRE